MHRGFAWLGEHLMSARPSGTVTFLFTDIEGSTQLAPSHADHWETMRSRHDTILKSAIESNHGYIFQAVGDGFCTAFDSVCDAVAAAAQAQKALQQERLSDVVRV